MNLTAEREKAVRDITKLIHDYRPYIADLRITIIDTDGYGEIRVSGEGFPSVKTRFERKTCCAEHAIETAVNGFCELLWKLQDSGYTEPYD